MLTILSSLAFAADPVLVPPPPVHDDTSAILQVYHASGKVRVKAEAGKILKTTLVQGGVVLRWMPPDVDGPTEVAFHLRAKGQKEDTIAKVMVIPGFQAAIDIKADRTLLDPGESTLVTFKTTTKPLVAVNVGTLGPLVADGAGFKATYTPPTLTEPARALLVASDPAAPNERWGTAIISLRAPKTLTLAAPADSSNVLDAGGHDYGPATASPAGKVPFEVKVDPDHPTGRLTSTLRDGTTVVNEVPLGKAPPAITFLPLPKGIPADTATTFIAACRDADGDPCDPAFVEVKATRGALGAPKSQDGAIAFTYTPPEGNATFSLTYEGATVQWTGKGIEAPANVVLAAIPGKKSDFTVDARVKTAAGTPDLQHLPILDVAGATVTVKPRDKKDGSYSATIRLDKGAAFARVVASTGGTATGLAPRRVVAWATQGSVPADGKSTAMVVIAVEDALGSPVPDVAVSVAVPLGDASVAPSAKTGRDGIARVKVRAGSVAGPVAIVATAGGLSATASLWQEGSGKPTNLVPVGPEDDLASLPRWQARVPTLFVSRGQKGPPPTVGAPPTMGIGPIASRVSRDPSGDLDAADPNKPPVKGVVSANAGQPPVEEKGPRMPSDAPFLRLRGAAIDRMQQVVASTAGAQGTEFAPEATWTVSPGLGAVGLQADAEIWAVDHKLGVDARGRAVAWRVRVGDKAPVQIPIEVEGGLRFKAVDAGAWSIAPGLGAFYTTGRAVIYGDPGRTRVDVASFPVIGARAGGSVRYESGGALVALDLQSVWTPLPSIVRAELGFDVPLSGALLLTGAVGADARWLHLASDTADARVNLRQYSGDIRLGVGFAAF